MEWRKTHQAAVATPRAVDGTKLQPPPDWPEGYPWDGATAKRVDEKRVAKKRRKITSTREFMSKHAAASYIQGCARGKQTRRQMQVLRGAHLKISVQAGGWDATDESTLGGLRLAAQRSVVRDLATPAKRAELDAIFRAQQEDLQFGSKYVKEPGSPVCGGLRTPLPPLTPVSAAGGSRELPRWLQVRVRAAYKNMIDSTTCTLSGHSTPTEVLRARPWCLVGTYM